MKMKNKLKYLVIGLAFALTLPSCIDDWLTITPEDEIVEEDFWQNGAQVESVVISCYRFLTSDAVMNRMFLWGELRSDNLEANRASTEENDIMAANILATNGLTNWADFYKIINICNLVIEDAPGVQERDIDFSDNELHAYLSEAMTIRALCYFYLVRTFGDVPMPLKATRTGDEDFAHPQVKEQDVLNKVIEDLELAEEYAQQEWTTTQYSKGRITKNAVRALLADVYLWNKQYDECIAVCDRVLDDRVAGLELTEGTRMFYTVFYLGNSPESIFELNFTTSGQMNNTTASLFGNMNKGGTSHFFATSGLQTDLGITADGGSAGDGTAPDYRGKDFVVLSTVNYLLFKYEGMNPPADFTKDARALFSYRAASSTANWIVYRLSDIYLMKAEAITENNPTEDDLRDALELVNETYGRATLEKASLAFEDYATVDRMKELVLLERRREFCFEGKRWFDLLRKVRKEGSTAGAWALLQQKYTDNVALIQNKMSMIEAWYLPINQTQMSLNKNLHQNAYYYAQEQNQ